jgi:hypothetical protein
MRTIVVSILVLAVAAVAGCVRPAPEAPAAIAETVVADDPKPPAAVQDVPPAVAELVKERNKLHKRQTGALLTITAQWEREPGIAPSVRVYWQIDYDGPRRPFTILTPGQGTDEARAHFWYLKPDGTAAAFTRGWGGVISGPQPLKQKAWLSVAADGKPVNGKLIVGGGSFLKRFAGRDLRPGDPPLWAQLRYTATDRGDGYEWPVDPVTLEVRQGPAWTLDAWTGELWSQVVEVTVK